MASLSLVICCQFWTIIKTQRFTCLTGRARGRRPVLLAFSCTSLKSCDIARDVYKRAFSWGVTMSTSFYSFLFDDMECRVDPLPLTTLVYLS